MKCPYCNTFMTYGISEIHGTTVGKILVGMSYENLYFRNSFGTEIRILQSGCSTPSYRCPNCEIVILNKDNTNTNVSINESDFAEITRESITNCMLLWSSKEIQMGYQKRYSEQSILEVLHHQWKESYKDNSEDFNNVFSIKESNLLLVFDQEFAVAFDEIDINNTDFKTFSETLDYKRLSLIAIDVLEELKP